MPSVREPVAAALVERLDERREALVGCGRARRVSSRPRSSSSSPRTGERSGFSVAIRSSATAPFCRIDAPTRRPSRWASSSIRPCASDELRGAAAVELLAALPEPRQLLQLDVAALEPLDDPLELRLALLEASARALSPSLRAPRTRRPPPRPRARCPAGAASRTSPSPARTIA